MSYSHCMFIVSKRLPCSLLEMREHSLLPVAWVWSFFPGSSLALSFLLFGTCPQSGAWSTLTLLCVPHPLSFISDFPRDVQGYLAAILFGFYPVAHAADQVSSNSFFLMRLSKCRVICL